MKFCTKILAALAVLTLASPAYADPISTSILAAIGVTAASAGTALATYVAITTFVLSSLAGVVLSFAMTSLFGPKQMSQDRQASIIAISIGDQPASGVFVSE